MKPIKKLTCLTFFVMLIISCKTIGAGGNGYFLETNSIPADEFYKLISEKCSFEYNKSIFAAYAFANYTGFDYDNFRKFSDVRAMVRADLYDLRPAISYPDFYKKHREELEFGLAFRVLNLGPPPMYKATTEIGKSYLGLSIALREFHNKAAIDDLYEKYRYIYEEIIEGYSRPSLSALTELCMTLRLNPNEIPMVRVIPNLLESNSRSLVFHLGDTVVLVTGPCIPTKYNDKIVDVSSVIHEFSHSFINPMVEKSKACRKLEIILENKYGSPSVQYYKTWESVIDECFVRALSFIPEEVNSQAAERIRIDENGGFLLERYIYNRITNEYNGYYGCFNDFCERIINDYIMDQF